MASEQYNRRFSAMSLTVLRKVAAEEYGLTGLSKAPRERVQAAINVARQAKPMDYDTRVDAYQAIRNLPKRADLRRLTARQLRRINKKNRKARG